MNGHTGTVSSVSGPPPSSGPVAQPRGAGGQVRRILVTLAGVVLLVVGILLLILPGPGLLLVLAGMTVLASEYEWARRRTAPVRRRALETARASVASPVRIAGTALAGLALIAAGVVWGLRPSWLPSLPAAGWATGSSLILSGLILLGILVYSYVVYRPRS